MHKEIHNYSRKNCLLKGRHLINFECVLDALDVYSGSQAEFDAWLQFVNKCYTDYNKLTDNLPEQTRIDVEEEFIE